MIAGSHRVPPIFVIQLEQLVWNTLPTHRDPINSLCIIPVKSHVNEGTVPLESSPIN